MSFGLYNAKETVGNIMKPTVSVFIVPVVGGEQRVIHQSPPPSLSSESVVFRFCHDGLECLRVVHGEVGQHLAVHGDACLVERTHQLRI